MHRSFLPEPIARDQIERIARVIRRAPSGGFSQGQSIVVITDPATRAEVARRFEDELSSHPYIANAPVHMVISANEAQYHARYNEPDKLAVTGGVEVTWPVPYWFVDAGALMMLVLMAAIDEGLASAFIGHPEQKRIFDELLGRQLDRRVLRAHLVHECGEPFGDRRVLDLEHVLRVLLAAPRQVERADEH